MSYEPRSIPFIHILRAIAALLVLWAHIGGAWYAGTHGKVAPIFGWFRENISTPLRLHADGAHLAVILFFLISGYIVSHVGQKETVGEFATKRFFRLAPTLILAVFLMWTATALSAGLDIPRPLGNAATTPWDYVATAFLLDHAFGLGASGLSVTWTLYPEVIFYILFAMLIPWQHLAPMRATIAMLMAVGTLVATIHVGEFARTHASALAAYLPFFIIGRMIYLHQHRQMSHRAAALLGALSLATAFYVFEVCWPGYLLGRPAGEPGEPIITYFVAVAMFFVVSRLPLDRTPRIFLFFGDISYALYLLHYPVGYFTMNLLHMAGAPLGATIAAGLAASVAAAAVVSKYIEKPLQRSARAMLARGSTPAIAPVLS